MLAEEARERAQVAEDRLGTLRSARMTRALLEIHRKDDTAAEQAVDDAHEAHREAATHAEATRRTLAPPLASWTSPSSVVKLGLNAAKKGRQSKSLPKNQECQP